MDELLKYVYGTGNFDFAFAGIGEGSNAHYRGLNLRACESGRVGETF